MADAVHLASTYKLCPLRSSEFVHNTAKDDIVTGLDLLWNNLTCLVTIPASPPPPPHQTSRRPGRAEGFQEDQGDDRHTAHGGRQGCIIQHRDQEPVKTPRTGLQNSLPPTLSYNGAKNK